MVKASQKTKKTDRKGKERVANQATKKAKEKEVAKRTKVAKVRAQMKCVGPVANPDICHVTIRRLDKLKHQRSKVLQVLILPRLLPP